MNRCSVKKLFLLCFVFLFVQLAGVFSTKSYESHAFMNRARGLFARITNVFRTNRSSYNMTSTGDMVFHNKEDILRRTSDPREGKILPIPENSSNVNRVLNNDGTEFVTLIKDNNYFTEVYKNDDISLRTVRTKGGGLISEWYRPDGQVSRREFRGKKEIITTKYLENGGFEVVKQKRGKNKK